MKDILIIIGSIIGILTFIGGIAIAVVGKLLKDKSQEISNHLEIQHLKEWVQRLENTINDYIKSS